MDWKSSRIDALLEQALIEDQTASDATTNLAIDPKLRAAASICAREEMVVAGLGAVLHAFYQSLGLRSDGLPNSVQIAAAQYRDNLVLRAARDAGLRVG